MRIFRHLASVIAAILVVTVSVPASASAGLISTSQVHEEFEILTCPDNSARIEVREDEGKKNAVVRTGPETDTSEKIISAKQIKESQTEADETEKDETEVTGENSSKKTDKDNNQMQVWIDKAVKLVKENLYIVIAGVMVLLALIIILVVVLKNKKRKKNNYPYYTDSAYSTNPSTAPKPLNPRNNPSEPNRPSAPAQRYSGAAQQLSYGQRPPMPENRYAEKTVADMGFDTEKTIDEFSSPGGFDDERTIGPDMFQGASVSFIISFDGRTQTIDRVFRDEVSLGRGDTCDIDVVLGLKNDAAKQTSRVHAFIVNRPDGLYVRDNNSRNGTLLNGKEIIQETLVQSDDIIQLGKTMVRVHINRN